MESGGAAKVDLLDMGGGDGFAVGAGDGAVSRYPHVTGVAAAKVFKIRAAAAVESSVEISFKSAPVDSCAATCWLRPVDWQSLQTWSACGHSMQLVQKMWSWS
jgi:hypothetical protein